MRKKPINMLGESDVNHLRRLLGYVRCEIGLAPDDEIAMVRMIVSAIGVEPDDAAKKRLVQSYEKSARVPKYVRDAVKALEQIVREP